MSQATSELLARSTLIETADDRGTPPVTSAAVPVTDVAVFVRALHRHYRAMHGWRPAPIVAEVLRSLPAGPVPAVRAGLRDAIGTHRPATRPRPARLPVPVAPPTAVSVLHGAAVNPAERLLHTMVAAELRKVLRALDTRFAY